MDESLRVHDIKLEKMTENLEGKQSEKERIEEEKLIKLIEEKPIKIILEEPEWEEPQVTKVPADEPKTI